MWGILMPVGKLMCIPVGPDGGSPWDSTGLPKRE
jgi:hypothetical protein